MIARLRICFWRATRVSLKLAFGQQRHFSGQWSPSTAHMLCLECGQVFEFFDKTIEERQKQVAREAGFFLEDHSLYMYGVCEGMKTTGKCSMKKKKRS